MQTYIALLRGINVSGHKLIRMEKFRTSMEQLSFTHVKTYIQSGNLIFDYEKSDASFLEEKIHYAIEKDFGFDVPVLILSVEEVIAAFDNNPFINDRNVDIKLTHVVFLKQRPTEDNRKMMLEFDGSPDEFVIMDKRVYLYSPNGTGKANVGISILERRLKVAATARNWKTVTKLVEMSGSGD